MDADKKKIWVSGQTIEVTDAVYEAYMKGDRKMRYFENDLKAERILLDEDGQIKQIILSREDSLDRLMDDNAEQWEVVIGPWCGDRGTKEIKVDVYMQVMNNWDIFVDYVWNEGKKQRR